MENHLLFIIFLIAAVAAVFYATHALHEESHAFAATILGGQNAKVVYFDGSGSGITSNVFNFRLDGQSIVFLYFFPYLTAVLFAGGLYFIARKLNGDYRVLFYILAAFVIIFNFVTLFSPSGDLARWSSHA